MSVARPGALTPREPGGAAMGTGMAKVNPRFDIRHQQEDASL